MLLILFGFPLIAFINSYFFTAIFQKYMPKKEEHKETDMVDVYKRQLQDKFAGDFLSMDIWENLEKEPYELDTDVYKRQ